jgi:hypothetical protein
MKRSYILMACLCFAITCSAQKLITVQNTAGLFQFDSIDSALYYAVDGDQIFIPGGIFNIGSLNINKSVMIFGAGHFHDSTLATGVSALIGDIVLGNGASGGILTGFDISGDIKTGPAGSDSVSNYTISRCAFRNLFLSDDGLPPTNARFYSVYENIIHGNVYAAKAIGLNCSKNFIEGSIGYLLSGVISNNNFLAFGDCSTVVHLIKSAVTTNFDNNIFLYTAPACSSAALLDTGCANNIFMNNLFLSYVNFPVGNNSGFNNIFNQPINAIFVSASGGMFQYTDDYHLKPGSPGIYAGTDNHDIGAYGTAEPFKTASVPFNPHIIQKSIGQNTNPQGLLNVHIKVAAQEH